MSINTLTVNGVPNTTNEIYLNSPDRVIQGSMWKAITCYSYSRNTAGAAMTAGGLLLTQFVRRKGTETWYQGNANLTLTHTTDVESTKIARNTNTQGGLEIKYVVSDARPEAADTELEIRYVFEETQG